MTASPNLRVVKNDDPSITPAHDLDAEYAVLTACLQADWSGPESDPLAGIGFLEPHHFFGTAHQRIFQGIRAMRERGTPIDSITVGTWLKDKGWIGSVGGMQYLTQVICAMTPTAPARVRAYAVTVYDKARMREASAIAQRLDAESRVGVVDVQPWLQDKISQLQAIANRALSAPTTRNYDALLALVKKKNASGGRPKGISTGIAGLDRLLGGGLHSGHKITIAALPGVGKTALAGAIAEHVASEGYGVLFFSTEMEREELLDRMIARRARVAVENVTAWRFTKAELDRVNPALEETSRWPIAIDETPGEALDVDMIAERAKAAADTFLVHHGAPLALIVVDYVQNLKPAPRVEFSKTNDQVKYSTRGLKAIARELRIPLIELAQSKPLEKDRDTGLVERPGKGKIADSSEVEKCSNALIHIWRQREDTPESLKLVVPKTRGAAEGVCAVRFESATQRFTDMSEEPETPPMRHWHEEE